jgi:hypothetical protein
MSKSVSKSTQTSTSALGLYYSENGLTLRISSRLLELGMATAGFWWLIDADINLLKKSVRGVKCSGLEECIKSSIRQTAAGPCESK